MNNKDHPLYVTWKNMRRRCNCETYLRYADWGGRGITVTSTWDDFWAFVNDMGEKPTPKHTLDRRDNDKGYSKENCKWSTVSEQNLNQRIRKDNSSGHVGIRKTKSGSWMVRVCDRQGNGGQLMLGTYPSLEQALCVRDNRLPEKVLRSNNTSGARCVYKSGNKFKVIYKGIYMGTFESKGDAEIFVGELTC